MSAAMSSMWPAANMVAAAGAAMGAVTKLDTTSRASRQRRTKDRFTALNSHIQKRKKSTASSRVCHWPDPAPLRYKALSNVIRSDSFARDSFRSL